MSEPAKSEDSRKGWTSEDWKNLVEAIQPLLQMWFQYQKDKDASSERKMNALSHHNRRLSISLIIFLVAVVGLMSGLTLYGKVSGDALLFLVGTVTGYVVIMIQDLMEPLFIPKEED
jgi:hypothetical protein